MSFSEKIKSTGARTRASNRRQHKSLCSNNCVDAKLPESSNVVIFKKKDLDRLKAAAKIKTFEDKFKEIAQKDSIQRRKQEECEHRIREMLEIDEQKLNKTPECKEDDIEKQKIMNRVFLVKQEQEEEIKRANRIILERKCHIIRDAQVAEKHEISKEIRDEEIRLEKRMLAEREEAIKAENQKRDEMAKLCFNHYQDIKAQLDARENLRKAEAARIESEAVKLQKAKQVMDEEKRQLEIANRAKKETLKKELQRANEISSQLKKQRFEEQRIAELKAQEYMSQKRAQTKQLEREATLAREVKQKAHDRMLKLQQQMINSKSKSQEVQYRLELEQVERDFRQKEKAAVVRKQKLEKEIMEARLVQLEEVKKQKAVQMAREEHHFQEMITLLKNAEQKDKVDNDKKIKTKECYRNEIIHQMEEKLRKRRDAERIAKEEYFAAIEENKLREKNIKSVIKTKIQQMRESNMPEKFIKDVERKLEVK